MPLHPQKDLFKFLPHFTTKAILDIQYALLKYRNLQPDGKMSSLQFFQYNNLLNKDQIDDKLDPWAISRGLRTGGK